MTNLQQFPLEAPPFTITALQAKIPAKCFERSMARSFFYFFRDLVFIAINALIAYKFIHLAPPAMIPFLWLLYSFCQGVVGTGLWVIGHECGHQSFSESKTVNNTLGMIVHSFLLVPYHSWRISHGMHHKATGHMDRDMVFVPAKRSEYRGLFTSSEFTSTFGILFILFAGWISYLTLNFGGQTYARTANHFDPRSPIFKKNQKSQVLQSDLGLVIMFSILGLFTKFYGFSNVFCYYVLPYIFTHFWIVLITYLHHTNFFFFLKAENIPHYRGKEWTFVRGALCTLDRDYGSILNFFFHHLGDTHVCHHLFSTIPHYHAEEATKAMQPILGNFYKKTNKAIIPSIYETWRTCHFVEDKGDVLFYKRPEKKPQ